MKGETTFICKDYDPELCRFQCKLLAPPNTLFPPYTCVEGGGNCIWELVKDEQEETA